MAYAMLMQTIIVVVIIVVLLTFLCCFGSLLCSWMEHLAKASEGDQDFADGQATIGQLCVCVCVGTHYQVPFSANMSYLLRMNDSSESDSAFICFVTEASDDEL